jgi:5-(carboxyamino)imidazole ribonucleotide synthase
MHRSDLAPPLRPLAAVPLPRLGILGGGQLAKMTAAARFGCEVVVLEREGDFPAHSVDTPAIVGDWNDPRELLGLAPLVDVVTIHNEFVDTSALAALEDGRHRLWPSSATVALVQDKLRQAAAFAAAGLPLLRTEADLPAAWAPLDGDRHPLHAEEFRAFAKELATIVTHGHDGALARYPVVETFQRDHVCYVVVGPAAVSADVAAEASDLACRTAAAIGGVGSFGMELFPGADGRLEINESAPRVHNSGHCTIEACACSQIENHGRAVLGQPLGSTTLVAPAAAMVNLLGHRDGPGVPLGLLDALREPGASVDVCGKSKSARGRKMGHVTALGATPDEALSITQRAADCIRFGSGA